jgi:hypothetical protein
VTVERYAVNEHVNFMASSSMLLTMMTTNVVDSQQASEGECEMNNIVVR